MQFSNRLFTPLTVILHILSKTILIILLYYSILFNYGNLLFLVCYIIFGMKKQKKIELFARQLLDQAQISQRGLFLGPELKVIKFSCITSF